MATFDATKPVDGSFLVSEEVRDNFSAVSRANELRPQPGLEADDDPANSLKVFVNSGRYATDGQSTKSFTGQMSGAFVAPTTNNRIDILYITLGGALSIHQGSEAITPVAPPYPADATAIAEVTLYPGITEITSDDFVDVRPMFVLSAAGFGINPIEEAFVGDGSTTLFSLTAFAYAPGQSELNVYVGGVHKESGVDYTETSTSQFTFSTPPAAGVRILVWKVGSASAHALADLDDVDVATSEAVTDPDSNRTNTADRNNPFATLADVAGAIPFSSEHDEITGEHGPRVNITQSSADRALSIEKTNTGTGVALNLINSGTDAGIAINQVGAGIGLDITENGNNIGLRITQNVANIAASIVQNAANTGLRITHNNATATALPLSIRRATTAGTREPLINLRDIGNANGANISFYNNEFSIADQSSNTRKLTLNTVTGALSLTSGTDVNRLVVTKTTSGAGDCINVTSAGSGNAARLTTTGGATGAVLRITNGGSGSAIAIDGVPGGTIDPLYAGAASNADSYHTHASIPENLSDLDDVSNDEASGFNDSGTKRDSAVSAANPFATLADIESLRAKVVAGTYTGNGTSQTITTQVNSVVTGSTTTFQPGWVMIYNTSDNTRSGVYVHKDAGSSNGRFFNASGAADIDIVGTGFTLNTGAAEYNAGGVTYLYIALGGNP